MKLRIGIPTEGIAKHEGRAVKPAASLENSEKFQWATIGNGEWKVMRPRKKSKCRYR